ncbi:MAG TPA: transglutaminase family protein [Caulobacteraceae bacterium]|jgi:transglutaminase-like putative cysteine protease
MLFEIRHITQYHYDEPVRESVIEVRMQPRKSGGQGLVGFDLEIEPAAQVLSYADCWGNAVHHFDIPHQHQRLEIIASSVVETYSRPSLPDAVAMEEWEALQSETVRADCWDFLSFGGLIERTEPLAAFIEQRNIAQLKGGDPLTALRQLNSTLYEAFDYEAGITTADSPIDHALTEGRGVCQDFAHIMIALARGWGVPARYVSGYLFTDSHDRSTSGATHAWVEVFLPSLGWIGLDPTNDAMAGERHLAVAIGRDYSDAPTSHGVFKGEAESRLSVGVSVRKTSERTGQPEHLRMGAPALAAARRRASNAERMERQGQQ